VLNRRQGIAAAVTLACALGVTATLVTRSPGTRTEAAPPPASLCGAGGGQPPSLARPAGSRRAADGDGAASPAPELAAGRARDAGPVRSGRVRGLVSDVRGDPVPGAALVLRLVGPEWGRRRAVSDERGEFSIERVPVGTWSVERETRGPPVWEPMAGLAGTIEVLEGRETWLPVQLEGERRLTGALTVSLDGLGLQGSQGFVVDLSLRPEWDPDTPVARASVHSFAVPPWEAGPPLDPEDDLDLHREPPGEGSGERPEWVAGAFRFEDLRPGRYTLEIRLEDNEWITVRSGGEERRLHLFLEREVDLTLGDVELAPETLDFWQDFVRTALERD